MHYLLTASLLLILLWPAYALLLRYSDRYVLHRFLLLLLIGLVAALPFVDFSSPAPIVTERVQASLEYVEATTYPVAPPVATSVVETATAVDPMPRRSVPLLPTVYLGGGALLLLILLYRLFSVFSLHLRSRPENGYRVLPAGQRGQAFTFGPFVYVSADLPGSVDFSHVLAHEKVHARQWHSVDVLLGELLLCVFWFHPVAWWLRTKLRANLEYLVDAAVARRTDKRSYQLALVRQSQNAHRLALSLPFSEPTLKDRISRMTGVPQYRLLAGITAVGLLFWLGLSFLVLNGNTQHAPHATYLEATAGPGDPYYEHYREIFSGNVYSVKIYTNRMVTVDEYLQLRAILSQAKDTKLYVAKNAFDDGFSLAVQHRQQAPATAHLLQATPDDRFFWRLRLEYENGSFATSSRRLGASARAGEGTLADLDGGLGVFVNNRPISLLPAGTGGVHEVNGVNVARLGAADWPMVRVEGQNPRSAPNRLAKALRGKLQSLKDIQFHQTWQPRGTYREWYENLDVHAGRSSTVLYNDRDFGATLDFVLDTEFGPEAMIQVAYERDVPNGDIVLQVIDDDPTAVRQARQSTSREVAREVDIYLKRLPNAYELEVLQRYVSEFPGFELRLFQSCLDNPGHYTLHLGGAR
ncbi:MAG: M56 family metallopeptidase, partial [Bacteroidota bacterium]